MAAELIQALPDSWESRRLDDVATIIDSLHKTPTYSGTGRAMVRVTDVQGGFLDVSDALRVTEDIFQEFTRRHAPKRGDIVFSRVGSYGNASYVNADTPFCIGQNTALISPRINGRFLHLFLQSAEARRQIEKVVVGSTQKTISLKSISGLQIPVPPAEELEAIAHILGTLDDKIELNWRMNATLEAMARALFQSWFVDFDPVRAKIDGRKPTGLDAATAALFPAHFQDSPLGHIPQGWKMQSLGEVVEFAYGKPLKAEDRKDGPIRVYGANGLIGWHNEKLVSGPGIVVGRKGNPGVVTWAHIDFFPIDTTFYVVPASQCRSLYFLYYALSIHNLAALSADSAVPGLNRNHAYMSKQVIPPPPLLAAFDAQIAPIFTAIHANEDQSRTLATLRNTLLPKLLTGELQTNSSEEVLHA